MRKILPFLLLAGCTVGPNYQAPKLIAPQRFAEPQVAGEPGDLGQWWRSFNDPVLTGLVERGLAQNLDLRAAASRVRQARYEVAQSRAALFPSADIGGSVNRTELSKNGGFAAIARNFGGGAGGGTGVTPGEGIGLPGTGFTTWTVGPTASWQIDIFGGATRGVQAARARVEQAEWSRRDTGVTIASEIATGYLQLRLLQRRLAIANAELRREQETLQLLEAQARNGLIPAVDADRQRTQIAAAKGTIDPIVSQAKAQIHALGILVGGTPEELTGTFDEPPPGGVQLSAPPIVPAGLPSDLLRRRPDIRAAERRLAAATADIGVAVADLYPKINLNGAAQFLSLGLSNLFSGDSVQLSGTAGISFPLLDFGRRKGAVGVRREQREQSYVAYQQTVLRALSEVEDALARIDAEQRRAVSLRQGVASARRSVDAIRAQYRVGLTSLTAVLDAQAALLQAEDNLAQSEGSLQLDIVQLYRALGGGWESLPTVGARPAYVAAAPAQ
ncbi:MAG: efflux transporter outer membrane subunit [Sphingomonadaceae bacterium]|nr:efflux transporter outer membrane subunit [Sphingomonadaceae bacterium]